MRIKRFLLLWVLLVPGLLAGIAAAGGPPGAITVAQLPAEAQTTLGLIRRGGPYPYRQDDARFGNRERLLPQRPHNYYREYTVPTPGARDRGARRIVSGGSPPVEFYYTDDHYRSFKRIKD